MFEAGCSTAAFCLRDPTVVIALPKGTTVPDAGRAASRMAAFMAAAVSAGVLVPDDSQVPVVLSNRSQASWYPARAFPDDEVSGVLTVALMVATEDGAMEAVSGVCTWFALVDRSVP